MPRPELYGIGSQVKPAIDFAQSVAINMHRELNFPGQSLGLFEKTPSGETLLLELFEDWTCYDQTDSGKFPEYPYLVVIIKNDDATKERIDKSGIVKIGSDTLKITSVQGMTGARGVFYLRAKRA